MYSHFCRICLNTHGSQTQLQDHKFKSILFKSICIEQKNCKLSYKNPNKNIKLKVSYMKIGPSIWTAPEVECKNKPEDDSQETFYKQTKNSRL